MANSLCLVDAVKPRKWLILGLTKTAPFVNLPCPGVDILQKKPKNAQGNINSAQAKFPESPKKVFLLPRNEEIIMFFALNCHF